MKCRHHMRRPVGLQRFSTFLRETEALSQETSSGRRPETDNDVRTDRVDFSLQPRPTCEKGEALDASGVSLPRQSENVSPHW